MRAVRVAFNNASYTGVESAGRLRVVPEPGTEPISIIAAEGWEALRQRATEDVNQAEVRVLSPVRRPGKILCTGLNYKDHATEQGLTPPDHPILFAKMPTSVIGPGDPIPLHEITAETDYEAELAIVIGKPVSGISVAESLDVVAGYTALNDVSARDLQRDDGQWVRAKSLDGYAPMGPALVSPDEVGDPMQLDVKSWVNGELRQESNTRNLIFDIAALIAFCAEAMTLEPGDVIATGTPGGVGMFMNPPRFLRPRDQVTIYVEGIGELSNEVQDPT